MDSAHARILVIDDSVDLREFFQFLFESAGYDVEVATDGLEGLGLVRTFRPHLIITNVSMPRMNGCDFLVRLRSDFTPPLPPVIVCSGFDTVADEVLRLGAVRFVAKPVEPVALLEIVEQALRGEAGDRASLALEREFACAARARAAAAAAKLLASIDLQAPELLRTFARFVQWVSDYFGYANAAIVLVQDSGDVLIAAVSRGSSIPAGSRFSGRVLYTTGVLASGSSIVLADAAALPLLMDPEAVGVADVRFLVGVPLVFQDVPVGALCLVDREPHPFDAEDLLILEQIGRFVASGLPDMLQRLRGRTLTGQNVGLVPPAVFDCMLAAELLNLHRERGGLDLLFVELDPASLHPDWVARFTTGTRLGMSRRDACTLAIFKRASAPTAAAAVLSDALTTLGTVATVQAVGWVSLVDEGRTPVPSQVLLQLAEMALEQARLAPELPVERIVIRREGWPADQAPTSGRSRAAPPGRSSSAP